MTSIVYDPQLLKKFRQIVALAQAANFNDLAKKFLNRLERSYQGAPNISSGTGQSVGLNLPNLSNIGALLKYLADNKISIDGDRVSYSNQEFANLPENEQNQLATLSINESRDPLTRKWNEQDYWINWKVLLPYVQYLQEKAHQMEQNGDGQGTLLHVMLGKLIDSINAVKQDSGLSRAKPKADPENPNVMHDDEVLDSFNTKTLNTKAPFQDMGSNQIKLYAKDIKTADALKNWLRDAQLMVDKTVMPAADDLCQAVHVLYQRAKFYRTRFAQDPKYARNFNYYLTQMTNLGSSLTGNDNKSCKFELVSDEKETITNTQEKAQQKNQVSPEILARIAATLPFAARDINFDRIEVFFREAQKILSNNSVAMNNMNDARELIPTVSTKMTAGDRIFHTGDPPRQFILRLKNAAEFYTVVQTLMRILSDARSVVEIFYATYGAHLSDNQKTYVLGQIGETPNDYSIYKQNFEFLDDLAATSHT